MTSKLSKIERNALLGMLSNLEYDAGDVYDNAPSIKKDEDAYWAYHQWHAIKKLLREDQPDSTWFADALASTGTQVPTAIISVYDGKAGDHLRIDFDDPAIEEFEFIGKRVGIVLIGPEKEPAA